MRRMKLQLKNWLFPNDKENRGLYYRRFFLTITILYSLFIKGQIANYVTNGGFEQKSTCNFNIYELKTAYGWNSLDSANIACGADYLHVCTVNPQLSIPSGFYSYQFPRNGNAFIMSQWYCTSPSCTSPNFRSYPRNRLKTTLQVGKTYCAKMNINLINTCRYGIDAIGMYFSNSSIDTISKCALQLTFINPQVQNTIGNVITDTLNWITVTGTFVANGTEKFLVIGNFKNDINVNTMITNPSITPEWSAYNIDDVSCIDIDLPAYAGPDLAFIPGGTVYIGRPQDVGIDEACTWYNITNTNTAIGNAAGITVSPVATTTYVVKQDICGNIKWDTVVVYQSALGLGELKVINESINLWPIPASETLKINFELPGLAREFTKAEIINSVGQLLFEIELNHISGEASVNIKELPNGVYFLSLKSDSKYIINKRFVVAR